MSRRHILVAAVATAALATASVGFAVRVQPRPGAHPRSALPTSPTDYANIALDIVPSGEYGSFPAPANAEQQADMYDALTPLTNNVSESQLTQFFKPMGLGNDTAGSSTVEQVPNSGVTIVRDQYDVPHIFGVTRDDVTWGAGWVMAEDRGLLLNEARYDSLLAAIDAPGSASLNLIGTLQSFKPSAQTEKLVAQADEVAARRRTGGARGPARHRRLPRRGSTRTSSSHDPGEPLFTRTDIYAFNALKDQFVGEGGGQQAQDAEFLAALQQRLGKKRGFKVWNDLREANDPEAPVSVPGTVHFQKAPTSLSGNVLLASQQPLDGRAGGT